MTALHTFQGDLLKMPLEKLESIQGKVDVIVTSPPYKEKDGYSHELMVRLGEIFHYVMKPGARAFVNFAQLREGFSRSFEVPRLISHKHMSDAGIDDPSELKTGQTIIWTKSIAIDDVQKGHYQPINSDRTLNYCWEFIFTFYKGKEPNFDRLALGVPYADKSNLSRGSRGKNGDKHCGGDIWFVPYRTTGKIKKKRHAYEFPESLVERCIKVSGVKPGALVFDPFCGSGTTAVVASRLGMDAATIDIVEQNLQETYERWSCDGLKTETKDA